MSDMAPTHEQEILFTSTEFNDKSISRRFGNHVFERDLKTKEELDTIHNISNVMTTKNGVPGEKDHEADLLIQKRFNRDNENINYSLALTDFISFDSLIPVAADRKALQTTLSDEIIKVDAKEINIEDTKYLASIYSAFKDDKEWELQFDYYDGYNDGGFGTCDVRLVGKPNKSGDKNVVKLDLFGGIYLSTKTQFVGGFDKNISLCQDAVSRLGEALDLRYTPVLKYEFVYPEGSRVESFAQKSSSFREYFYNSLANWSNQIEGDNRLRAVIGRGKSGDPIFLLEDPTVQSARERAVETFMTFPSQIWLGMRSAKVFSHDDIFTGFADAIANRSVDPNLASEFPSGDSRDWLHMFVYVDKDEGSFLVEDFDSNIQNKENRNLIRSTMEKYGIGDGGKISKEESEKIAKAPMLMPVIDNDAAEINHKYGGNAAKKYRQSAINWLINGSLHSKEVYDTFQVLLNPNKTKS